MKKTALTLLSLTLTATSCGGLSNPPTQSPGAMPAAGRSRQRLHRRPTGSTPIQHIVLIIQENRTFNNLFAQFPGATGTTVGKEKVNGKTESIQLAEVSLAGQHNLNHNYPSYVTAYDNGKMDGFNRALFPSSGHPEGSAPYVYVNPSEVTPYWTMASEYALANAMFTTQGSASFTAHQDLIRGGTEINQYESLIDNPPYGKAWGCDDPPGTTTSLITTSLQLENGAGPFPCSNQFPYYSSGGYRTLRDLLDAKSVSWKYYTPKIGTSGAIWSAFDVIAPVRYGSEWGTNVNWPPTNIFNDISNGTLASMSWIVPDEANSDHPDNGSDTGPSWVTSIVNAIGESQYWDSTAIIVVWDDWGGFYDSVKPPPHDDQGGPGFRVPMIVISPYSRETSSSHPGYISNTVYEFGSIIRFIEDTWNLGRLGTTDGSTTSMADMLDFNQYPRTFTPIGSKYSRSFFLHQRPSQRPVDTE